MFGLKILHKQEIKYNLGQTDTLALFYDEVAKNDKNLKNGTSCIVFSMDRAIQLHALLGSLFENLSSPIPTFVIYRPTNPEHEKAYEDVISIFRDRPISFVKQTEKSAFRTKLLGILEKIETTKLFFLVDDILVTENINVSDLDTIDCQRYIFSLRLGENLNICYMAKKTQPLPKFLTLGEKQKDKICWQWDKGLYDWGYPLSVDGHIFLTKEVLAMTKGISFNSPNTYEGNLQIFKPIFDQRYGMAYKKSKLFNIPCNKVQTDNDNEFGDMHQDDLLARWQAGEQIDFKAFYGFENTGVHQDAAFNFKKRNAK
jgi:hypothetical protein